MLMLLKLGKQERLDEDGGVERQCLDCGEWWPADKEFYHRNTKGARGMQPYCRACMVIRQGRGRG